jgi:hypothetical protein
LKGAYENIGEPGSLTSPTTLAQNTGIEKKLAKEYLQKESRYNFHQNHRTKGRDYRKPKAFYPWHIFQADPLTLDAIQRPHNKPFKYILLAISVFSWSAYAVPLQSKRGNEVAKALESIFEQDSYEKFKQTVEVNLLIPM